jgi:prepilin-type N-terminal cleavage/methylation domain-containing protein
MHSSNNASDLHSKRQNRSPGLASALRRRARRGFTLVETMIATAVFTMGILGVYAMMLKSYELVTLARHRDNGRALLLSFADQFLRLQTTDLIPGSGVVTRQLFANSPSPTGDGLSWTDSTGTVVVGTGSGLLVTLGEAGSSQVPATVTRVVNFIDSTTGNTVSGATTTAAGWMLEATFTITYSIRGRTQTQSLTVARSVR